MKKLMLAFALVFAATGSFAHGGHHGWHGRAYHHHCGDWWGRGGSRFWPGFVGGVVGGVVGTALARPYSAETVVVQPAPTVVTTPTVVQQPVVIQQPVVVQQPVVTQPAVVQQPVQQVQNVWVEGRYVDQVQANGTVTRIWQPGHYEQRTVLVQ